MTKEIAKKIKVFDLPIPSSDVPADTKKLIYAAFERYGMSQSTIYLRMFSKGFDEWELMGIDRIKADFLEHYKKEILMADSVDEDGNIIESDRGYAAVLALNADEPGGFYAAIKEVGLVRTFKEYMAQRGMSPHTTFQRFTSDEWKPWEKTGVGAILTDFCQSIEE